MPSKLICEIVKIGKFDKHPNANTLSMTQVYNFPAIFRTGEFQEGDKAIYFPVEAMLPIKPEFAFLWNNKENPTERNRTIKAKKLRGVFSMGILMPAKLFGLESLEVGTNVAQILGIFKYEPPEPSNLSGNNKSQPNWFIKYTDIESARKYSEIFIPGEEVIITEKIHGSNARFAWINQEVDHDEQPNLWIGSHRLAKQDDCSNEWSMVAKNLEMKDKLSAFPNLIFFGEIYGKIQAGNGYHYDIKNKVNLVLFDIFDIINARWLNYDNRKQIANTVGFPMVPELYRGPWTSFEEMEKFADGTTILGKYTHNREGCVIRPTAECWNEKIGRVILKIHGKEFLINDKAVQYFDEIQE